jgi:hypothetical protein
MTTNFLGIPVAGDIIRGEHRKSQRPLEEFAPILQAVLDDPTVTEFGWRQYTPYFNDGDACVFGASQVWVRTDADADTDQGDLDIDYNHPSIGKRQRTWNRATSEFDYAPYEGPDESRYDRCTALGDAIDGGEFDDVLLTAFGDHADVTVRRAGIKVETYDHD